MVALIQTAYIMAKVIRTRNAGTLTEAAFWNMFKNALRKLSMFWKPGEEYLKGIRELKSKLNKESMSLDLLQSKSTYGYPCKHCLLWFTRKGVEKDHIVNCGHISSFVSLGEVAKRMFIETDEGWQCLCKTCHNKKTWGK